MQCALLLSAAGAERPAFERIDAHVHVAPPPAAFLAMLERQQVRVLNVTLVDPLVPGFDKPEPQATWAAEIARQSGGWIGWAAPFDPAGFESAGWAGEQTKRLEGDFARGAAAVKIYKSVGMQMRSAGGRYVLPDDPAFAPALDFIARKGKTLLAHLGEPRSSWRALDLEDPHYAYYKANPEWHMFTHPERPTWEAIIAARDRMLAAHPKLRVVGCHLGSMEHDVDEVARRLDKYPNLAVDTAARMGDLMRQPREKVRAFLIRYQDRVLWGTDQMELKWEEPAKAIERWEAAYAKDWQFLATAETFQAGGRTVRGLALPEGVLRKIFRENALRWIPGVVAAEGAQDVEGVLARFVEASGGEAALRKVTSRGSQGRIFVATYGEWGEYSEYAKAPNRMVRSFRFPRYTTLRRAFDGKRAWEENPDSGVEVLTGARFAQVRRQAEFHPALSLRSTYPRLSVKGRERIDEHEAVVLRGLTAEGDEDLLWFDVKRGLLLAVDSTETFSNGVSQRVRYMYEEYRELDGVQVPHQIRYESPRMIWVVTRQVAHNIPVDDSVFLPPEERK